MHISWGSNPICFLNISCIHLVVDPDDVSLWKTNICRLGTLCHHEKCRGFGLFLDDIFINLVSWFHWYLFQSGIFNHVLIWIFDIIWATYFLVTLVCTLLVNWCFVRIVSRLVLESFVHAYLLYVYLMACLLSLIQYIG